MDIREATRENLIAREQGGMEEEMEEKEEEEQNDKILPYIPTISLSKKLIFKRYCAKLIVSNSF